MLCFCVFFSSVASVVSSFPSSRGVCLVRPGFVVCWVLCVVGVYCFCWLVVWLCGCVRDFVGCAVASCMSRVAGVYLLLCLCSSGCSVLFWVVRCFAPGVGVLSVLLLLVAVALLVGCGGCVALSAFLLLVAPVWSMLLLVRVLFFLVVGLLVLLSPLFC